MIKHREIVNLLENPDKKLEYNLYVENKNTTADILSIKISVNDAIHLQRCILLKFYPEKKKEIFEYNDYSLLADFLVTNYAKIIE